MLVGAQLAEVLSASLNPATTHSSEERLRNMQHQQGFAVQLLVISDDQQYSQSIRQSAVVYLKNLVQAHCEHPNTISPSDLNTLKESLLQALIRNVARKEVAPSLKEIIYQLAEKYYPQEWPQLVGQAVEYIQNSGDPYQLLGSIQALRAVYSVFGGSVMKQTALNNLCIKSLLPLLGLISKLFQNFSLDTSAILVSCFKTISAAVKLHLPQMVAANIHNIMILIKKMLDLPLPSENYQYMVSLKKISLRILFRMYMRHANPKMTQNPDFALQFHEKYTHAFIESLVLQVITGGQNPKQVKGHYLQLGRQALSCLAYLNRYNVQAARLLVQHRDHLLKLCLSRSELNFHRHYQNFHDFKAYVHQKRVNLKEFLFSMMQCEVIPENQEEAVSNVLGLLWECLEKGSQELRELALYLFSEISNEAQYFKNSLDDKMSTLIVQSVIPMLEQNHHPLVRGRACELIQSYSDIQLPEQCHINLAQAVWACVNCENRNDSEAYMRIYACHAFNSLMKYPTVFQNSKGYLRDILRVYTSLLQSDTSIIKNFEDLVNLFEDEIAPIASQLAQLLIDLFSKQITGSSNNRDAGQGRGGKAVGSSSEDDSQSEDEEQDTNNESIGKACVASLRQLLQGQKSVISQEIRQQLVDMVVYIFSDPMQIYVEQGYNILNLLLYKLTTHPDTKFYIFFQMMTFAIMGLPQGHIDNLKKQGDQFSNNLAEVLSNVCVDPDPDTIENCIGCLRNFIAKSSKESLYSQKDQFNNAIIDYVMTIAKSVHQNQTGKRTQTERLIILTLYVTLLEHNAAAQQQLKEIIQNLQSWLAMEEEAYRSDYAQFEKKGQRGVPPKLNYSPVYTQILLLAVHLNPDAAQIIDINNLMNKVYILRDHYKCDYELERIIFGLSAVLERQLLTDETIARNLMNSLPEMVRRLCRLRQDGQKSENDHDMNEEAEVELMGDDQNTFMGGWQQGITPKDMMLGAGKDEDEESDNDWEEEFNKFYDSPLDSQDELKYLAEALQKGGNAYGSLMDVKQQEQLSLYLKNAPPKNQ